MFGLFGKPRRSFADIQQETAQPYNDRIDAAGGKATYAQVPQAMPQQPKGDGGRRIAGILGDFLLGLGGQQGVYGPMMAQQRLIDRRSQEQAQQAEAERAGRREQFMFEHDYKRSNPLPSDAQPYRWRANDGDLMELGPDGAPRRVHNDETPKMNFIPDGMGGGQWIAVPGAAPSMLMQPVGKLTPIGGPASAPGGFPR